jgi:hypothetical protein
VVFAKQKFSPWLTFCYSFIWSFFMFQCPSTELSFCTVENPEDGGRWLARSPAA